MTVRITSSHRAFRVLRELGLTACAGAASVGAVTGVALEKAYDVPDWAACAVRAPLGNLGLHGWRVLLRALLDDGELRAAVVATWDLAGRAAAEELIRARVPVAFEWLDAWAKDGSVGFRPPWTTSP